MTASARSSSASATISLNGVALALVERRVDAETAGLLVDRLHQLLGGHAVGLRDRRHRAGHRPGETSDGVDEDERELGALPAGEPSRVRAGAQRGLGPVESGDDQRRTIRAQLEHSLNIGHRCGPPDCRDAAAGLRRARTVTLWTCPAPCAAAARGTMRRPTPSSSARVTTVWSRRTCSPTRAGRSSSARRRRMPGERCAPRR